MVAKNLERKERSMTNYQDEFNKILSNYSSEDAKLVHKTIDMLCDRGVGAGCYQDYGVLADIITVLGIFC